VPGTLDWVFFTAAAGRSGADQDPESHYRAVYYHGIANLLTALEARAQPPSRVVFSGSTSVYGQNEGSWVTEESPTEPSRFNGKILLEAGALLERSPYRTSTVRFGGIYGPGRTWLLRLVSAGTPCAVEPVRYSNRIHRDDAARAMAHVARLAEPARLYLAVDDEPTPFHEVIHWLADRLGVPRPPSEGAQPSERGGNKRCSNQRLRQAGFEFTFPDFKTGYAAVLQGETE